VKKILVLALALALFCSSAAAESDSLAELSFNELVMFRQYLSMYLMSRPEFKHVTVPEGIYKIGTDIPAGDWNIISVSGEQSTISYFEKLDQYGNAPDKEAYYMWERVVNVPDYEVKSLHFYLKDGMYIKIDLAPVIFTSYIGPEFSFE